MAERFMPGSNHGVRGETKALEASGVVYIGPVQNVGKSTQLYDETRRQFHARCGVEGHTMIRGRKLASGCWAKRRLATSGFKGRLQHQQLMQADEQPVSSPVIVLPVSCLPQRKRLPS